MICFEDDGAVVIEVPANWRPRPLTGNELLRLAAGFEQPPDIPGQARRFVNQQEQFLHSAEVAFRREGNRQKAALVADFRRAAWPRWCQWLQEAAEVTCELG